MQSTKSYLKMYIIDEILPNLYLYRLLHIFKLTLLIKSFHYKSRGGSNSFTDLVTVGPDPY